MFSRGKNRVKLCKAPDANPAKRTGQKLFSRMLLRGKNLVKLCEAPDANSSSQQSPGLPQTSTASTPITTHASDTPQFSAPSPRITHSSDSSITREASPIIGQTSSTSHEPINNLNSATKTVDIILPVDDKELLDAVNSITASVPYNDHHRDLTLNANSIEDANVLPSDILLEENARTPSMEQCEDMFGKNNLSPRIAQSPVESATTTTQPEIIQNNMPPENIQSTHVLQNIISSPQNPSSQQSSGLPQTSTASTLITTQASDTPQFSAPSPRITHSSDLSITREASPIIGQTSSTSHEPIDNLNSATKTMDIILPIDDKELLDAVNSITASVPYYDHHRDLTVNVNSIEDANVSPSDILLEANARIPYMEQCEDMFGKNNLSPRIGLSPFESATTITQPEIIQCNTSPENIQSTNVLQNIISSPQNPSSQQSSGLPQTSIASTLITTQASDTPQFSAPSPRITHSSDLSVTREASPIIGETSSTSHEPINNLPPACERHECSDPDYIPISSNDANDEQNQGRPKRGRKRKYPEQNRDIRKKKTNCNEDYISVKGKEVTRKIFSGDSFDCKCPKKCTDKVTAEERKKEFDRFWMCGNYGARCAILQGCVTETETKRSYTANSKRSFTRYYRVNGKTVCKKTFLNTFGISQTRIDFALKKFKNQEPVNDQRGQKSGGKNATSPEKLAEIKAFINSFPRYVSHYSRNSTTAKYLAPNLNIAKLYDLYKEKHPSGVSLSKFSKVFHEDFNLCFKKNQKDTCYRCDRYKALKSSQASTSTEASTAEQEHKEHLDRAYNLRNQMKQDLESAKTNPEIETLTFDLEKTHCLPKVPTSIVYYKRQLNLHNLGIHRRQKAILSYLKKSDFTPEQKNYFKNS
ncbi:mucin-5AC-like [Ostrinia nubilalis]|uniref:mucin-5AC-like n=1 Tax=Ostrinia nubilalis TaxID=29057 RepID=UPI00308223DA